VVRSLERVLPVYLKDLWPQWKSKWEQYKQLQQTGSEMLAWIRALEEYNRDALLAQLLKDRIVGFALTCMLAEQTNTMYEMLSTIIDAGIPIAFFPRYQQDLCTSMSMEEIITECLLCTHIPTSILKKRQEAVQLDDAMHPAHHLTLLWDEAELDRLPPPARALFPGMS
jgi:hypothetical protein